MALALVELRGVLPVPFVEFIIGEEQGLLAHGLTPARLGTLRAAWDEHGDTICQDHWDKEEQILKEDLAAQPSGVYARFVRRCLVDDAMLFT